MTPRMRLVLALTCVSAILGTGVVTVAQERSARGGARQEAAPPPATEAEDEELEEEDASVDASSEVVDVGGEKVKVYRFSGLDISGRLKSPQLLYFLNRLRAEFDRPRLPHRSFLPELERSAQGKAFR